MTTIWVQIVEDGLFCWHFVERSRETSQALVRAAKRSSATSVFGKACSRAEVLANSNFQDTHNRVQASAPSRLQDYPQQWPPARPSTSARPLGVRIGAGEVNGLKAYVVLFIQRRPARSRCLRSLPRRSDLMSCNRCTVSNIVFQAGEQAFEPSRREHREEQEASVLRQREGWPPDECRVLGYRSCCCAYPPCRWWRYPPLRPGTQFGQHWLRSRYS